MVYIGLYGRFTSISMNNHCGKNNQQASQYYFKEVMIQLSGDPVKICRVSRQN